MPNTPLKVVIDASVGRGKVREFPLLSVEAYTFEAAMDVDADSFSLDVGDPNHKLGICTDRDTEVRCTIFSPNVKGRLRPVFSGIADGTTYGTNDMVLSISGRDLSSLALGDAPPGRWRHVKPAKFIEKRARALGLHVRRIHRMAEMGTIYTDGSETEWAFWYRLARSRGMYMWTEPLGGLVIDHLGYSLAPTFHFGEPPRGKSSSGWIIPDQVTIFSNKQRQGQVWVYAQDSKTGVARIARGIDTSIRSWRRKPIKIISSTTAKSQADAKTEADQEIFESIVGAQEIEIVINDIGILVEQNKMARINIPEIDLVGNFFIVGVRSQAGADGKQQTIRLREKGFALSKRVPRPPTLEKDPGTAAVTSSLSQAIAQIPGIRWSDSFVRATREFGVAGGWDTAVFLAVLLSICQVESGFANVREGSHTEWVPIGEFAGADADLPRQQPIQTYHAAFANAQKNPLNPRYPGSESGVGPMQLTTPSYKDHADEMGWNGRAAHDEYTGGRWNPDSNIRESARVLVEKGNVAPKADPTNANNIWIAVARYHGSPSAEQNQAYVAKVKAAYSGEFAGIAQSAVTSAQKQNVGTERSYYLNGYGTLKLYEGTPDIVVKAVNFAMNRRGDRYVWGGSGPLYDCSSFITAAYASADASMRAILDEPKQGHHGETTYTLFRRGRFDSIARDKLLPGDLVFFNGDPPEHMGMYLDDGLFIADSNSAEPPRGGVKISSLSEDYYTNLYVGARRIVQWLILPGQRAAD